MERIFLTLRKILPNLSDLLEIMKFQGLSEKFCELVLFEHCGVHVSMAALPFNSWVHGAQLFLVVLFPSSAGSAEAGWKIRANCTFFLLLYGFALCTVLSITHVESCVHMAEQCRFCLVLSRLIQSNFRAISLILFPCLGWSHSEQQTNLCHQHRQHHRTSLKVWSISFLSVGENSAQSDGCSTFLPQELFGLAEILGQHSGWQHRPGHRHWAHRGWAHWGLAQSSHRSHNGEIGTCWRGRMDKDPGFPFSGGHSVSVSRGGWVLGTTALSGSLTRWHRLEFQSCQDTELVFQAFL